MTDIKIISNVQDIETGVVHYVGDELSVSDTKAGRWIEAGLAVKVKGHLDTKEEKKFDAK